MGMTFDATLKDMGRESPNGFLTTFDQPPNGTAKVLNADLSTVTRYADLVIGIGDPLREIIHLDFQSGAVARKHRDLLAYNALLYSHYNVPVHTVLVLLRPSAAHSNQSGVVDYSARPGRGKMTFEYEVVPIWEIPSEQLLQAELGVLPLAILGQLPEGLPLADGLDSVVRRIAERVKAEATPERALKVMTDTFLLAGLRVSRAVARQIFTGVRLMEESDTYLAIVDEGQEKATKKCILRLGRRHFGNPSDAQGKALDAITDLDHLERLFDRVLDCTSWHDLLETP